MGSKTATSEMGCAAVGEMVFMGLTFVLALRSNVCWCSPKR